MSTNLKWMEKRVLIFYLDTKESETYPYRMVSIEDESRIQAMEYLKKSDMPIPVYLGEEVIGHLTNESIEENTPPLQIRTVKKYRNSLIDSVGKLTIKTTENGILTSHIDK
jgi:hypothetical protein